MSEGMRTGWKFLTGDVNWEDYGGKWAKKAWDNSWWILRFENCEEWGDGATGYSCDIQRIDLLEVPGDTLVSALSSCGWAYSQEEQGIVCSHSDDVVVKFTDKHFELVLIDCLSGYGCYAPMGSVTGESYPDLVRAAGHNAADEMMADSVATARALAKPANALGATAADFGCGDPLAGLRNMAAALLCGELLPTDLEPQEALVLQMYNASGGKTLGGAVESELAAAGAALRKES